VLKNVYIYRSPPKGVITMAEQGGAGSTRRNFLANPRKRRFSVFVSAFYKKAVFTAFSVFFV
jgi:hypothetical protein